MFNLFSSRVDEVQNADDLSLGPDDEAKDIQFILSVGPNDEAKDI